MSQDIVVIFLTLVSIFAVIFVLRSVFSTVSTWDKDVSEWFKRRKLATRLLSQIENKPRERLVEIALALALTPYRWPNRIADDDRGLVWAREWHLSEFASMSDEELKQWIREKVQDTRSLLIKVALESLESAPSGKR